jgi:hypothetical protein
MARFRYLGAASMLALAGACVERSEPQPEASTSASDSGEPSGTDVDSGSSTQASTPDLPPADPCNLGSDIARYPCQAPEICEPLGTYNVCSGVGGPPLAGDWQCTLAALRDNTVGQMTILVEGGGGIPGTDACAAWDQILLLGDGTAVYWNAFAPRGHENQKDFVRRVHVQPPEYFEECASSGDEQQIAVCLSNWFVPDACIPEACCPLPDAPLPACG